MQPQLYKSNLDAVWMKRNPNTIAQHAGTRHRQEKWHIPRLTSCATHP